MAENSRLIVLCHVCRTECQDKTTPGILSALNMQTGQEEYRCIYGQFGENCVNLVAYRNSKEALKRLDELAKRLNQ